MQHKLQLTEKEGIELCLLRQVLEERVLEEVAPLLQRLRGLLGDIPGRLLPYCASGLLDGDATSTSLTCFTHRKAVCQGLEGSLVFGGCKLNDNTSNLALLQLSLRQ